MFDPQNALFNTEAMLALLFCAMCVLGIVSCLVAMHYHKQAKRFRKEIRKLDREIFALREEDAKNDGQ